MFSSIYTLFYSHFVYKNTMLTNQLAKCYFQNKKSQLAYIEQKSHLNNHSLLSSLDSDPRVLAEWALGLLLARPLIDAVGMIGVVAGAPGDGASFILGHFVGLALQARLVDAVLADGAVLDGYIPAPQGHCVPLLYLNPLVHLHSKYYYQI